MDHAILQAKSELLRRMSADDFARLKPYLESVFLELRAPLETAGRKIEAVYFLESGLASVVAKTSGSVEAEVGIIGFEGMTGSALIMGDDQANLDCYVQSTSEALRMAVGPFVEALERSPTLRSFLLRYDFHVQTSYTAAVNARQSLEVRLARWLLMCGEHHRRQAFHNPRVSFHHARRQFQRRAIRHCAPAMGPEIAAGLGAGTNGPGG